VTNVKGKNVKRQKHLPLVVVVIVVLCSVLESWRLPLGLLLPG